MGPAGPLSPDVLVTQCCENVQTKKPVEHAHVNPATLKQIIKHFISFGLSLPVLFLDQGQFICAGDGTSCTSCYQFGLRPQ